MENYRNKVTGEIKRGIWTTDHAASSYGQPVLVIDGQAVDHIWWERYDNPAATLGRKGGSVSSPKKTEAVRLNAKLGGRPRKFHIPKPGHTSSTQGEALCGKWVKWNTGDHELLRNLALLYPESTCAACLKKLKG